MTTALCPRSLRLNKFWMCLPLCLALAGCGTSISPANSGSQSAVTVTLSATPAAIGAAGSTTLTATVTNNAGAALVQPTGNVTFIGNSGVTIGTGVLKANSDYISSTATITVNGAALALGSNSITASYYGDGFHSGGSSPAITVTVGGTGATGIATTTALTPVSGTLPAGGTLNLNVIVTPASGTIAPSGTVQLLNESDGFQIVAIATLSAGPGISAAVIPLNSSSPNLISGANDLYAVYVPGASSGFATSYSSPALITAAASSTGGGTGSQSASTIITATPAFPTVVPAGTQLTLQATVTAPSGSSVFPTGQITFVDLTTNQNVPAQLVPVTSMPGTSTAKTSVLANTLFPNNGIFQIAGEYSGDVNYSPDSSPSILVQFNNGTGSGYQTATTISSNYTTVSTGDALVLSALVTTSDTKDSPTGQVEFIDMTNGLSVAAPLTAFGQGAASAVSQAIPASDLAPGNNIIVAEYLGEGSFFQSTSASTNIISGASGTSGGGGATVVTITPTPTTVAYGGDVSFAIVVAGSSTGSSTSPTGTVILTVNGIYLGSTGLSGGYNGSTTTGYTSEAQAQTPFGASGTYAVLATYSGDSNYAGSSGTSTVTVEGNDKAYVLTDVGIPVGNPSTVTLGTCFNVVQATVTPMAKPNDISPTGTLIFYLSYQANLGTATLDQTSGIADLKVCTGAGTSITAAGSYVISADYSGDGNYNADDSYMNATVNVLP